MMSSFAQQPPDVLTVSQLNTLIRGVINQGCPAPVWVCGEIQGFNRNKDKNHIFFELCEKDPVSKDVLARIGLVIFAGRKRFIQDLLKSAENAFALKDDIEVKFLCTVDFYPPHGAMRLVVESIDPVYTLGKIAQERQRLIEHLRKAGVLDANKTRPWPELPLRIGLITAHDSAAYNDFLAELRSGGWAFEVFCRNALMQGKAAPADVCRAMDALLKIPDLDVMVITRGGGSIADLSCFDNERIARGIAACPVPVLSGIGHEINTTVTDLAAHTYQKTPTAAARLLVQQVEVFAQRMDQMTERLIQTARELLADRQAALKSAALVLQGGTQHFLRAHHQQVTRWEETLRRQPLARLQQAGREAALQEERLEKTAFRFLQTAAVQMRHYERMAEMAHPRNTLKRGFSITRTSGGQLIRSCGEICRDKTIITQFLDGTVESRVETTKEEHDGGDEIR